MSIKTSVTISNPILAPAEPDPEELARPTLGRKAAALAGLTKPRVVVLILLTVAVGFLLGARQAAHPSTLLLTMLGTGLVAGGASAWNQVLERSRDARMRRTAARALPTGRLTPLEAAAFGTLLAALGVGLLALGPHPVAALVALATFVLYAFVYTPLKPVTTLNTVVGAVPGALPPVIGWSAATGGLGIEAWALFLIVFLWQFPHFLAIAWIYRDDYERGGYRMLPIVDPAGRLTARQAAYYALALVPGGLLPAVVGLAGPLYFAGALVLGLYYLAAAALFCFDVNEARARRLLRASFLYLPAILLLLLSNPLPL